MPAKATGLPDPRDFGDLSKLPEDFVDWIIQKHIARRAGKHYDVRLGTPETGLFSWSTRKDLPEPGGKSRLVMQPIHEYSYGSFQGVLPGGYGAGTVSIEDKGKVLITHVDPDKGQINFTLAHRKFPERFTLVRSTKDPRAWYLINVTPQVPLQFRKQHYTKIPAEDVEQYLQPGASVSAKIDGAGGFLKLLKNRLELVSYRASKTGHPIVHTERFFGGIPRIDIPQEFQNQVLRGEIYGVKTAEWIHQAICRKLMERAGLPGSAKYAGDAQIANPYSAEYIAKMVDELVRPGSKLGVEHLYVLDELRKRGIRYAIGGDYAARNIRPFHDLDVFVLGEDYAKLLESGLGAEEQTPLRGTKYVITTGDGRIRIFPVSYPKGFSYEDLEGQYDVDEYGNPVWSLNTLRDWKKALGR